MSTDRRRWVRGLDESGEVRDFEFQFRRRDGEIRTRAPFGLCARRDDAGSAVAYQGFILDITERKQAETEIRRRNQELAGAQCHWRPAPASRRWTRARRKPCQKSAELFALDAGAMYLLDEPRKRPAALRSRGLQIRASAHGFASIPFAGELLGQIRQSHATLLPGASLALPEDFRTLQKNESIVASPIYRALGQGPHHGHVVAGLHDAARIFARPN